MKKTIFGLFATIMFINYSFGQRTPSTPLNYPLVYQTFKNALEGKVNTLENTTTTNKTAEGNTILIDPFNGDQQAAEVFMSPLLQPALNVLYFETFTDADIIDEYGSLNSPKIVQAAVILLGIKTKELKKQDGFIDVDINTEGKMSASDSVLDCIKDASGLAELTVIGSVGLNVWLKQMGKKAAMRALVKIGAKYFGWVGAAIFAYDVIECIATGD